MSDDAAALTTAEAECTEEEQQFRAQLSVFVAVLLVILVWSVFVSSLYCCCLKARLDGAPALGAQFFAVTGTLQLASVVVAVAVFFPDCPDSDGIRNYCLYHPCSNSNNEISFVWLFKCYIFPAIEAVFGVLCFGVARNRTVLAHHLSREHGGEDGGIFTKIPAEAEMELTENSESEDVI